MKVTWGKLWMLVWCAAMITGTTAQTDGSNGGDSTSAPAEIWFEPEELILVSEGVTVNITWYTTLPGVAYAMLAVEDEVVSVVRPGNTSELISGTDSNYTFKGQAQAEALFIGYNTINIKLYGADNQVIGEGSMKMTVQLSYQGLTDAFSLALAVMVAIIYVNMGSTLDFSVIKDIVKMPIGPIIGLVCQYGIMPLIAFGLAKGLFPGDSDLQLGLFVLGCCPGGGLSNMWTHLLGGSLNLSIMMTCISTFIAFGSIPLWVLGMGPLIVDGSDFVIPYTDIAIIAISAIIPLGIGILIQYKLPKVGKILEWLLTPFSLFNIAFSLSFGVYSNRYVFNIVSWQIMVGAFGLPFLGYLAGTLLALLCKRKFEDIIAISIETGVQNATIALLILKFSLEKPAGDLTVVVPAISYLMTPIPILIAIGIKKYFDYRNGKNNLEITKEQPLQNNGENTIKEVEKIPSITVDKSACDSMTKKPPAGIDNSALNLSDEV